MSAGHWIRDPTPRAGGSTYARREQIALMGDCSEVEPGVLEVLTRSGRRLRWLQSIGGAWRLVSEEIGEAVA